MQIQVNINTNEPLSPHERAVLLALAGGRDSSLDTSSESAAEEPQEAAKTAVKATTPAKRAPAAKKPEPKPEPVVDDAADEDEENLIEEEPAAESDAAPTMQDAIDAATALVAKKKAPVVKAALADFGAARVSQLKDKDIAAFLEALKA